MAEPVEVEVRGDGRVDVGAFGLELRSGSPAPGRHPHRSVQNVFGVGEAFDFFGPRRLQHQQRKRTLADRIEERLVIREEPGLGFTHRHDSKRPIWSSMSMIVLGRW